MAKEFTIECPKCREDLALGITDIPDLETLIDDERAEAASDARDECDCDDAPDTGYLAAGRGFLLLSAAIEGGNKAEARYWLDRIAAELDGTCSSGLTEQVQQGHFSTRRAA